MLRDDGYTVGGPNDISVRVPRNPNLLLATSDLGGLKLLWLGRPQLDASTAGLRLLRFGAEAELASCKELALTIDGTPSGYPLKYKATQEQTVVQEAVQAVVPIETMRALVAAQAVVLDLCGLQRKLSPQVADAGRAFMADFDRRTPHAPATAALEPK